MIENQHSTMASVAAMIALFMIASHGATALAKMIVVEGTVTCSEDDPTESQRVIENICVFVEEYPQLAAISAVNGGFSIILDDVPRDRIIGRSLNLLCYDGGRLIFRRPVRIFESDLRSSGNVYSFKVSDPLRIARLCDSVTTKSYQVAKSLQKRIADSIIAAGPVLPAPSGAKKTTRAGIGGGILAVLGVLIGAGGNESSGPHDTAITVVVVDTQYVYVANSEIPGVKPGDVFSFAFGESRNVGFNFAPARTTEPAVFWNSAAIALSDRSHVCATADLKALYGISINIPIGARLGTGGGLLYYRAKKDVRYTTDKDSSYSGSLSDNSFVGYLAGSARLTDNLAIGVTSKIISQRVKRPWIVVEEEYYRNGNFLRTEFSKNEISHNLDAFDFDISGIYDFSPFFRGGLSVMNISATMLTNSRGEKINQRAYGCGLSLMLNRWGFGSEVRIQENQNAEIQGGLNFIPFYRAKIYAGYAHRHRVTTFGLEYAGINIASRYSTRSDWSVLMGIGMAFRSL